MDIGKIIYNQQPEVHKALHNKKRKRKRKRRVRSESLSFCDIDRMMRERTDVDESKCNGR